MFFFFFYYSYEVFLLPYPDRVFDNPPAAQKWQKSFCETHQGIQGRDLLPLQREQQRSQLTSSV